MKVEHSPQGKRSEFKEPYKVKQEPVAGTSQGMPDRGIIYIL